VNSCIDRSRRCQRKCTPCGHPSPGQVPGSRPLRRRGSAPTAPVQVVLLPRRATSNHARYRWRIRHSRRPIRVSHCSRGVRFGAARVPRRLLLGHLPRPRVREFGPTLTGVDHSQPDMPTAGFGRMTPTCTVSKTRLRAQKQLSYTPRKEGSGEAGTGQEFIAYEKTCLRSRWTR
jgi:hypothetical protein